MSRASSCACSFFFFNDPPTTEISPLPLPDALPIYCIETQALLRMMVISSLISCATAAATALARSVRVSRSTAALLQSAWRHRSRETDNRRVLNRSEEHTSELQSQSNLVCRLLLEKK